jgi:hypothetical protein
LRVHTTLDPRAEWTLKWLLKKFKATKEESARFAMISVNLSPLH